MGFRQVTPGLQWANSKYPQQWLQQERSTIYKSLVLRKTAVFYATIDRAFDLHVCACLFVLSVGVFLNALQIATFKVSLGWGFREMADTITDLSSGSNVKGSSWWQFVQPLSGFHFLFIYFFCKVQHLSSQCDYKMGGGKVAAGTRGVGAQMWLLTDMCY